MPVVSAQRSIVRHLIHNFGFGDADARQVNSNFGSVLDLIQVNGKPSDGLVSYGTVGLFQTPLRVGKRDFPVRLELVGLSRLDDVWFGHLVCAAAFDLARRRILASPGTILRNHVAAVAPGAALPHAYLTGPKSWVGKFGTVEHASITVHFLQVVPISDAEADFVDKRGFEPFEKLLDGNVQDLANPWRRSLVEAR